MRSYASRSFLVAATLAALALPGCSSSETKPPDTKPPATDPFGPIGERSDLPVDERITIENLSAPVDIVRDKYGRPHIYAATLTDAMRVEGYLVARDRHFQLEFFRRVSEGRLAEIVGAADKSSIDLDISFRHLGLARVAKKQYDDLSPDSESRAALDAYADGVTQVFKKIRSNEIRLPQGIFGIDTQAFTDWTGVDSLAIARLETMLLSYSADQEIGIFSILDAARSVFTSASADPLVQKRAGLELDLIRFAPADPATITTGYPMNTGKSVKNPPPSPFIKGADIRDMTRGYIGAMAHSRELLNPEGFGSNNWSIAPDKSATGHAMVASDPHLTLYGPSIFWPISVDITADKDGDASKNMKFAGVAFPGIPAIILGHNESLGWGSTTAEYDVNDVYAETLTPDGKAVMFEGKTVPIETIDEVINIQGGQPYTYSVQYVPHHGPIIPTILPNHTVAPIDPQAGALSVRWTGLEATHEIDAVFALLRSHDVDEARQALKQFGVGAQHWNLADTKGNILWTSHANIPMRTAAAMAWDATTYTGTIPCGVLPGDGSAEWQGYLDSDLVPWVKNPAAGFIATANNDPIGNTLDNDPTNDTLPDGKPMYLACTYDVGFREGRVQKRIKDHTTPFTTDDLSAIQADVRSAMGASLTQTLIDAIDRAEEERKTPGSHADLSAVVKDPGYDPVWVAKARELLLAWGKDADYRAASGIDNDTNMPIDEAKDPVEARAAQATLIFNTWLVRVLGRTFEDELSRMKASLPRDFTSKAFLRMVHDDPKTLATYDAAAQDSALWDDIDTPEVETRSERMIRALVDAYVTLKDSAGTDPSTYRWGAHHTVTFRALIPLFGEMSIPPSSDTLFTKGFPRPGDSFSVDASSFGFAKLGSAPNFTYNHGPAQRFVIEMDPAGPKAYNALPGGVIWDGADPHFRDEAEYWRKNKTHPVPFLLSDVIESKEKRTVAAAPR